MSKPAGSTWHRPAYEVLTLPVPFLLWYFVFNDPFLGGFWPTITVSSLILLSLSLPRLSTMKIRITSKGFLIGVGSALLIYGFFWLGFHVVRGLPGFAQQVSWVYQLRGATPISFIAAALLFPIGPTEELYWRGLIQGHFNRSLSPTKGLLLTSALYTLIHVSTFNPSLLLVALIGGLFWGYLYNRLGDLFPVLVSHVLFDELIFVILVIQ
ncbi:MAG TPA: type II CAAX endopeptidase family protein [Conexivisphaerales archaeon]|nr:type II CAAX endopeptidase family protein [Conexivisphaerales archaeon]